jgi:hypothetical protein
MDDIGAGFFCPPPPSACSFFNSGVSKNSTHAETKQLKQQSYKSPNAVCLQIVKQESGIADGSAFVVSVSGCVKGRSWNAEIRDALHEVKTTLSLV